MPIPQSRSELIDSVTSTYKRLHDELKAAGPRAGKVPCVDDWTVKELLAVRAWWSHSVADWIEAGMRNECPVTPAQGYRWKDTPRLNSEVVRKCRRESYRSVRNRLQLGYQRVVSIIDTLDDQELLDVGHFRWAGNYPVSRWISINTARQYLTARTFIRRALRRHGNQISH